MLLEWLCLLFGLALFVLVAMIESERRFVPARLQTFLDRLVYLGVFAVTYSLAAILLDSIR